MGVNSSYMWHSIATNRCVLRRGLRWQVRDGSRIKIWHNPWLLRSLSFKVFSLPSQGWSSESTIEQLILSDGRGWNIDMLSATFLLEKVELICKILLSLRHLNDRLVWHHTTNGDSR